MSKIKNTAIVVLIALIIGIVIYGKMMFSRYEKDLNNLREEKKIELKEEKKKIIIERDSLIQLKIIKYDSLLKAKQTIKYVPYEKPVYINRTLNDAINILSNYSYQRTKTKN